MYVVRRVVRIKTGTTLKAAKILSQLGKEYEKSGLFTTIVYWSGYTVPGPSNTIYMDWTQEKPGSPYAETANEPEGLESLYGQLEELQEESYIEYYEMV